MSDFSLYARMREHGTLAEPASEIPEARFALPSTIHWMRALAILTRANAIGFASGRLLYATVQKRPMAAREVNSACEQLLFALHQIAALRALSKAENKADVARIGIMAWYYGIYGAATAMVIAADGSFPDNHAATAQQWDRQIAANRLAFAPFGDRLSSLVQGTMESELIPIRARGKHSLTITPTDPQQAWGCCAEYLSGTADWEQWNVRERLIEHRDYKALGVDSFRSSAARSLRDSWYSRRSISFLHQASRYRGKANYRDAIYLAYGKSVPKLLEGFIDDLLAVLIGFSGMAAAYASARMGTELWTAFLNDLEGKRSISLSPKELWS